MTEKLSQVTAVNGIHHCPRIGDQSAVLPGNIPEVCGDEAMTYLVNGNRGEVEDTRAIRLGAFHLRTRQVGDV